MPFDVDKMEAYCRSEIDRFARDHADETFYAFRIDASLLCLNSLEQFAKTLEGYRSKFNRLSRPIDKLEDMTEEDLLWDGALLKRKDLHHGNEQSMLKLINDYRSDKRTKGCKYHTAEGIRGLRENTGDWVFQGFAELDDENGFDDKLYSDHYNEAMESNDGHAPHTAYALAMTELIERLRANSAFQKLKLSDDLNASWVDHDY